ncbi:DUF2218 domain-containing protein [Nocardia vaccinii]|uniref:DUF2218 domain-containing protein n=1 Tax=Nocardia vaccinii TaxID=1822 RepID=UPI00082B42A4|nr:DUF2218 domain-containing protein [Nocardia vaccinii]
MPTLHTRIRTDRPERYLRQFAKHATAMASPRARRLRARDDGHRAWSHGTEPDSTGDLMLRVEQSGDRATVTFGSWGTCVLRVEPGALIVSIRAADEAASHRIREIVTRDLERFGRGGSPIDWIAAEGAGTDSSTQPL